MICSDNLKNQLQDLCDYVLSKNSKLIGRLMIFLCEEGATLTKTERFHNIADTYFNHLKKKKLDCHEMLIVAEIIAR